MWRPSVVMRVVLGILGLIALLVGVAAWGLETEYGGGSTVGSMEFLPDSTVRVYNVDERVTDVEGPAQVLVFEGTQEEADAWVAQQEGQGRNYLIPALIILLGVVLVGAAMVPSRPKSVGTSLTRGQP